MAGMDIQNIHTRSTTEGQNWNIFFSPLKTPKQKQNLKLGLLSDMKTMQLHRFFVWQKGFREACSLQ